jgi:hypothetical protein
MLGYVASVPLKLWRGLYSSISAPRWHSPGAYSVWVFDWEPEPGHLLNGPMLVLAYEWSAGGVSGVSYRDFWIHHYDYEKEGKQSGRKELFDHIGATNIEDDCTFATLVAKGKLHRLGELPARLVPDHH